MGRLFEKILELTLATTLVMAISSIHSHNIETVL